MSEKLLFAPDEPIWATISLYGNGPIEDPNTESWFHVTLVDKHHGMVRVTTKDGIAYNNVSNRASSVYFAPRLASLIRGAIKRYVNQHLEQRSFPQILEDVWDGYDGS